jgi:hypothetical protein
LAGTPGGKVGFASGIVAVFASAILSWRVSLTALFMVAVTVGLLVRALANHLFRWARSEAAAGWRIL